MKKPVRILIVEDNANDASLATYEIHKTLRDCEFQVVETREDFIESLKTFQPDVVLADYTLPHFDGMKALKLTLQHAPLTPFIIWTGSISEDVAVDCVRAGANNYIIKDNLKRLGPAILRALEEKELLIAHKKAEEKVQERERQLGILFSNLPGPVYRCRNDADFTMEFISDGIEELSGYKAAEFQQRHPHFGKIVHPDDRERVWEAIQAAVNRDTPFELTYRITTASGVEKWVWEKGQGIRDPEGQIRAVEGFITDITERKHAEEALQNNEKRFRALIENGLDDISLLGADGTLLWESPSTIRNLGYVPNQFVGRNIFQIMHPDDSEWTRKMFAQLLQEPGSRQRGGFRLRRADDSWRWVEAIGTNMLNEPSVNAIVINYRDITEQKKAELELQRRNEDLALVNTMNEVINQGGDLNAIVNLLRVEFKHIFSSEYTNIYLLNSDGQSLRLHQQSIPEEIVGKIETLIGRAIPRIEIPVQEDGLFQSVLRSGHGLVTSDPKVLQKWIGEFVETASLPAIAKMAIRKLLPQIYKILNIKSTILVPLISDGKTLGAINVSGSYIFTEQDLKRIESICRYLTTALRRKQMEEDLRQSQMQYQNLVETSHDLIWSVDAEARFTFVNRASREVYGYEPEELIGRSFFEILDPQHYQLSLKNFKDTIVGINELKEQETYVRHRDGRQLILSTNSIVLRDEQGNVMGVVGSSHDITARKRAEDKLKEERNLLRTLIDNIPDRIYTMDLQGRKTLSNIADLAASGGQTMDDVIGKTDFDAYPPALAQEFWKFNKTVLESGESLINYEEPGLDPDGNLVSILTTKIPLHDHEGNVVGLVGIGRDITERKQSETERQALLEIMQGLANTKDLSELLKLVHHAIARVIYADNFFVVLQQKSTGLFEEIYSVDQYDPPAQPSKLENSITSYVFRSGTPLLLTHSLFDELAARGEVTLIGTDSPSWLGVPLKTSGRTIGVMAVQDYEHENRYSEREKDFLASIATQVALVIERKRAEEALRESEERFSSAFEYASIGMAMVTTEGRWSRVNWALCWLLGYSQEELLQKSFQDITHPEDLENDLAYVRQLLAGEINSYQMEKRYLHKSGHMVWTLLSVSLVQDEQGSPRYFISQIQDITERKNAERNLSSAREFLQGVQNSLSAHIAILDEQGRIVQVNTAWCRFGEQNGLQDPGYGVGVNYLDLCDAVTGPDEGEARQIATAIREILAGSSDERNVEYPCHSPQEKRWFIVRITRFNDGEHSWVILAHENITVRKQVEESLREEREKAQKYLNTAGVLMLALDRDGVVTLINQKGCEILGYPAEEIIGKNWIQTFLPKAVREEMQSTFQKLISNDVESQTYYENAILTESGEERLMAWHNTLVLDEHGQVISSLSSGEDITDRKRAEAELRASEERFRQLAENIQEAFWMMDVESGREIYMSAAVETIWGRPISSLMYEPQAFITSVFSEDRVAVMNAIEREKNGEKVQLEYRIIRPDGTLRWIWDRAFPIFDDSGKVKRIAGISADITERMQVEQELRKLSRAVEQSGSTILITDTSGNIEYVNPKFTQTSGYSAEEAIGQTPRLLKSGITSEEEYKQLWQTISGGNEWHGELLNKKKDGTLFWESVTISPVLNDRREITHFVGVKEDITERKQNELEIRRHIAELEAVYENGLSVSRLRQPSEIGNCVIETFARHLPWHHVTIRLRKDTGDELELVSFNLPSLKEEERKEAEQHFVARINKVGQGLSGWVLQTGVPFRTGNVHTHPQYIDTHAGIQSGLYVPLRVGDRIIGVISVESEAPNAFTEQDERLLATLANQTAVAFENARLYEAMQTELSERKRAENALRISETHYRALADSITDILFELDQNLHYTHWNKASETLTGILAQDAIGKSMEDIMGATEEQSRIKSIYEEVLRNHQPRTFETVLLIGGENRPFEVNAYPSMRGVSVVAKDVTDRKRNETIMQKRFELMEFSAGHSLNELMLRTVDEVSEITGSTIGFFHFMQEDQLHLSLQTWSTNAMQLFQVAPEDGGHLPVAQAGVWAEAVRQRRPMVQNEYESLLEKKGIPNGHVPIVREIVIPIIRNERIMAVMGIGNKHQEYTPHDLELATRLADYAWDITERKQMELALEIERNQLVQRVEERTADLSRANSNLARALRVKDEFLANMSHELRTPLNAILGLSESLGEQIAGPLNEKQQKYISTISESGHHLLSLINDILDLAKIDAGQITLDINKVDIHSVCQASLRMIKQLAQKKNQEVSLKIDPGLGLMWADERRLKQMIVNLLGNAVKFTPEYGNLGLEVRGDQEANQIAITVWDNGIGIKQEDLARLFQPFVQLDSGLAREATGTGLGLALVAQMARLHGGSVNAGSDTGQGSRFTIILPWEPALAVDTATRMRITGKFKAIRVDEKNKPTILLVEDTKEVVMMIKDYLELAGYKVFTAQDGIDGIVQARHVKPDLILMDVQMPRMDGFETTRKLRSDPNFRYTPIIALTALAMPHDRERCLEAGMDEYISKPVNLKALIKIIQSCLLEQESSTR